MWTLPRCCTLIAFGFSFEKKHSGPPNKTGLMSPRPRAVWIEGRQPLMAQAQNRLVFVGEPGTSIKMTRARGRSPKGDRLIAKAPFGHWKSETMIARLAIRWSPCCLCYS
jgi:hypothetical protein